MSTGNIPFEMNPRVAERMAAIEEVPFELVKLPSKGKLYAREHPLYNCETVEIKAMTAVEEDILASPALLKKGTVLTELMRSCLINKLIDPSTLLLGDKNAILFAIRLTFDQNYKVETTCPECDKTFPHTFDLSEVTLKELGASPLQDGLNLFEFTLPKSGKKVSFSLLTDADDLEIQKTQENRRKALAKQGKTSEITTLVTDRLIKSIKSIEKDDDPSKVSSIIKKMKAYDAKALRQYISNIEPDVLQEQTVECPFCGSEEVHDIPMTLDFFWPKWE